MKKLIEKLEVKIKREVELIDLIKVLIATVGGIFVFIYVDRVTVSNDTLRTQKQILDQPDLYPHIKIHYTN